MRLKKWMIFACAVTITASVIGGCQNGGQEENTQTTAYEEKEQKEEKLTVKVTEIEGNRITAERGSLTREEGPEGRDGKGRPEEGPEGCDGKGRPEKNLEGRPGNHRRNLFTGDGTSVTFTITDETAIAVESLQGTGEGTKDQVTLESVLEVTLDEDGKAKSILVKNQNAQGTFGGSGEVTNGTAAVTIDENREVSQENYVSSGDNENALRIEGAEVSLDRITVEKTGGESSNREDGDFYGQNAALLALGGAEVTITGADVKSDAVNGNGIFSYGKGTVVQVCDTAIRTLENNSGGIQTAGGGTTIASNLNVETMGNSSAAIRSDRGGGTVTVKGGTYITNGTGSPAIYSTADIQVEKGILIANSSEGVVVEGKNRVSLTDCEVTGNMEHTYGEGSDENIHCIMIYQSMSGDGEIGESFFSAEGGIITAKAGDMFYVTNTDCEIHLKQVEFILANDTFLRIEGNSSKRGWGTEGANGGDVIMTADSQKIDGNILVDSISSLDLTLKGESSFTGAVNPKGQGGKVSVTMEAGSVWTLTEDSYIQSFQGELSQIDAGEHHLYVAGSRIL